MSDEILIFILIFAPVMMFFIGIYYYLDYRRGKKEVIHRMKKIVEEIPAEEEPSLLEKIRTRWIKLIESFGHLIKPKEGEISNLRKRFMTAGYRGEKVILIFFGFKVFLSLLFLIGFIFFKLSIFKTMPSTQTVFLGVLFALFGFYLPNLWLRIKIADRKEKIQLALPDALDLLVVCVEAGMGLDAAINRVGEEMKLTNKELSEELRLLNLELRAGKQRREALKNLAMRTDLEDVRSLVTMLIQTEQFGTSIGQALRVHSDGMRTKRYQRAEEIAQKIPVKLIFPLILFIFPAILAVVVGPAIISIFRALLPALGGR